MKQKCFYSGKSQIAWTCKALMDGRTISHKTEIREMRGWRLGAIIHRLIHDFQWPIETEYRGPLQVAYYSLSPDADLAALKLPKSAKVLRQGGEA